MGYAQADGSNYRFESAFSPEEEALRNEISKAKDTLRHYRRQVAEELASAAGAEKMSAEWAAKGQERMAANRLQAAETARAKAATCQPLAEEWAAKLATLEAELATLQAEQAGEHAAEELLIGFNLNRSVGPDGVIVVNDTCGGGNPAADVVAEPGTYVVTRTEGRPPGDVAYYGRVVQ